MATNRHYLTLLLFVLSFLLVLLEANRMLEFAHTFSQKFFSPLKLSLAKTSNSLTDTLSFSRTRALADEAEKLRQENAVLYSFAAGYKAIEEENNEIRRLLGADLPSSWNFVPAQAFVVSGDSLFASHQEGVRPGTPVIYTTDAGLGAQSGVLVGKVRGVRGQEIEVVLPTHTESKIPVSVRDVETRDRRASGILLGRGGYAILDQVLTSESLMTGDVVVTTGEAGLPPELIVGFVEEVVENQDVSVQQAEVRMAINPRELEYVFFVTKY